MFILPVTGSGIISRRSARRRLARRPTACGGEPSLRNGCGAARCTPVGAAPTPSPSAARRPPPCQSGTDAPPVGARARAQQHACVWAARARSPPPLPPCLCGAGVAAAFALPLAATPLRGRPPARPLLRPRAAAQRARPVGSLLLQRRAAACACAGPGPLPGGRRSRRRDPRRPVQDRRRAGPGHRRHGVGSAQFFSRPCPSHLKSSIFHIISRDTAPFVLLRETHVASPRHPSCRTAFAQPLARGIIYPCTSRWWQPTPSADATRALAAARARARHPGVSPSCTFTFSVSSRRTGVPVN